MLKSVVRRSLEVVAVGISTLHVFASLGSDLLNLGLLKGYLVSLREADC